MAFSRTWILWSLLVLTTLLSPAASLPAKADEFQLRILHTNDMHSRFEQTSKSSGKCSEYEASQKICYGGFARVLTAVKAQRKKAAEEGMPILFLNAGDSYQGSTFFTVYKWKVVARFLDLLGLDVMSLGNHEFDDGVDGLVPFLYNVSVPVVTCNLDLQNEPELAAAPLRSFLVLEQGGRKIGIIGYLTPETKTLSFTEKVIFLDEVVSIRAEARKLKAQGVDILIAVGHSGYDEDLTIAREVEDIDVVVGGHTNTFLYTGTPPDTEVPAAKYPNIVTQSSGRKVAVVQAYAYTKYLGVLDLTFDNAGELVSGGGNPLLLNSSVPEDEAVLQELALWRPGVDNITKEEIGRTRVLLSGNCRFKECNLGNLITDAFVHYGVVNFAGSNWTNAPIAIEQGGGIRSDIAVPQRPGEITREDVMTAMPFFNALQILRLSGKYLLQALEWSVQRYDPQMIIGRGEFLQVSGIHVVYDISRPVGSRVVSATARCSDCDVPRFEPIRDDAFYNIILVSYLAQGGDNYTMFHEHGESVITFDEMDTDIVVDFIKERNVLYDDVEGRIVFLEGAAKGMAKGAASGAVAGLGLLGLALITLLLR